MNKWLFRAVGTVGVASGIWLLGGGAAHAQEATPAPAADPQAMRGIVDGFLSPTSGLSDLGLGAHSLEFLPGLGGIAGGVTGDGGAGGLLGGLTGSGGPLGSLTNGGGPLGGLTGSLTGGDGGAGGLLGGLTQGGPLGGITNGLTSGDGVLGGLTGSGKGGLLGGLTGGGALGGLTGTAPAAQAPVQQLPAQQFDPALVDPAQFDPAPVDPAQFDPAFLQQMGLTNGSPNVQTSAGTPADLDPDAAAQLNRAAQDLLPTLVNQAMADAALGESPTADPFDLDWDLGDEFSDDALLGGADLGALDPALFFADNPNVDVNWAPEALPLVDGLPLVGPILGDEGLGKIIVVGSIADKLPLVGPVLDGKGLPSIDSVPVVNQVVNRGLLSDGRSAGLPVVGSVPMVGDLLGGGAGGILGSLTGGDTGGVLGGLTGGLSGGDALGGLTGGLTGGDALGGLTGGLPGGDALGGLTGGLLGGAQGEPMRALPAPGMVTGMPSFAGMPTAITRVAAPTVRAARHAETDRPVAGEDAEFPSVRAESGLPLLGQLPSLALGRTLSQLPVVSELPVVGSLPAASAVLRSLPVVGTVANLLPLD